MSVTILKDMILGDLLARYYLDEVSRNVELQLLPAHLPPLPREAKRQEIDNLVQVQLSGDTYHGGYAPGGTLRMGGTTRSLRFQSQEVQEREDGLEIVTALQGDHDCTALHHLSWVSGEKTVRTWVTFRNDGTEPVHVELLSSFSLGGLTPYTAGDAHGTLQVHRVRSVWSMEGRLQSEPVEALQLEPSWADHAVRCERFGQVGSLPVNHWFPWLMIEDTCNHVFWGAQIAHNASWQMEIYRKDEAMAISGGLADYELGHWRKTLTPGEAITTPEAILTACTADSLDDAAQRLTSGQIAAINQGPAVEQDLPIVFNEYCTTWGWPSEENIAGILEAIRGKGFTYFVIDCGWYKQDGIPWDIAMGDYNISQSLFPHGLEHTVAAIQDAGLIPGIWFEIDNVGSASEYYEKTDHLLQRDGVPVTTTMRRFWNMTDPWVQDYLHGKVIDLLKQYGFGYIKMDYNDTPGLGCDGFESLGEGLRQNMAASFRFVEQMQQKIPGLIVENCASGGHKLEPKMLGATAMSSFSDAHECMEIPIIAANLHRVMQPRQSQIWAVIRQEDTPQRIVYLLVATMLGRMCISGDVTNLSDTQWKFIEDGMAFYKQVAPIIRDGRTEWFGEATCSYRHPQGWQGILRHGDNGDALCVFHHFDDASTERMEVHLPDSAYGLADVYTANGSVTLEGNRLVWNCGDAMSACAVYLRGHSQ